MVNTGQRIERRADQERRHAGRDKTKAYLVGGGIASLASAAASLTTGATRRGPDGGEMTEAEWRQAVQWQGNRFEVVSAEQTPAEANLQLS